MGSIDRDWFDPAKLFDAGYPAGLTSALRTLPAVRQAVREEMQAMAARRVLEIGPGDAPVADGVPGAVFMDIAPGFLRRIAGAHGVAADLFHAPFAPRTFDLVIAADVLTHIRPPRRAAALACMAELGRDLLLFNPEPGTGQVADSPSPSKPVLDFLEQRGYATRSRKFVAAAPGGEYVMRLVVARRV
jgi:hypothetical protein